MKISAIKKSDGKIWLAHGDHAVGMEDGDTMFELPEGWTQPNTKYRECWAEKDGQIVVDLAKAKAQKLEELRVARDAKLADSDKDWMIAVSQGKDAALVNAKKLALRELPAQAEKDLRKYKSLDEVEAYQPQWP